uniref:Uncharacterized protein n=1 Tax=Anopheles christyi TaxID=43041 RepID=A0A182KB28_9DIPT
CNRTLHGEAGRTYELQIQNPHGVYPFVCHLNFTATGGLYGDIVQGNEIYAATGSLSFVGSLCVRALRVGSVE